MVPPCIKKTETLIDYDLKFCHWESSSNITTPQQYKIVFVQHSMISAKMRKDMEFGTTNYERSFTASSTSSICSLSLFHWSRGRLIPASREHKYTINLCFGNFFLCFVFRYFKVFHRISRIRNLR